MCLIAIFNIVYLYNYIVTSNSLWLNVFYCLYYRSNKKFHIIHHNIVSDLQIHFKCLESYSRRSNAITRKCYCTYITCQKSWDTLYIFNLDETFVPLLPLSNVGFWEKYMEYWKNLSCAIMLNVSGTD